MIWIALGSIVVLILILWLFNRMAWGGGLRPPSYDLLRPAPQQPAAPSGAGLPEADQETVDVRCTSCPFVKAVPNIHLLPALLRNTILSQLSEQPEVQQPCPDCGAPMEVTLGRRVTHYPAGPRASGPLTFTVLRRPGRIQFEVAGQVYNELAEIEDRDVRSAIAAALHISEEES